MPRYEIDRGTRAFSEYSSQQILSTIRTNVFSDLDHELATRVPRPAEKHCEIDPIRTAIYAHSCRKLIEGTILNQISGYSALRWLYYCRRIPNIAVLTYLGDIDLYKITLAEAITSNTETKRHDTNLLNFPVHETVIKRVLRFSQQIVYLVNLHVVLQLTGKGIWFEMGKSAIPIPKLSSDASRALFLFDRRMSSFDQKPLARLGTGGHGTATQDDLRRVFALVVRRKSSTWIPSHDATVADKPTISSNYGIHYFDFEKLSNLIADVRSKARIWNDEAGVLLIILRIAAGMFREPSFSQTVLEVGYVPMDRATLIDVCASRFDDAVKATQATLPDASFPANPSELIQQLEEMPQSLWPVRPGPVVRSQEGTVYLDLASATLRLNEAFSFPRVTGAQANVRAQHFEESVQAIISNSVWREPFAESLRGRTIRRLGQEVTDIDAAGAKDGRLLLVSCKSILYAEYETADYRVMRNASELVEKAVSHWARICCLLRENLKGDNYDFSSYQEILGVVCTPVVVYTPLGISTNQVAEGLYAAVSITELQIWLSGRSLAQ